MGVSGKRVPQIIVGRSRGGCGWMPGAESYKTFYIFHLHGAQLILLRSSWHELESPGLVTKVV